MVRPNVGAPTSQQMPNQELFADTFTPDVRVGLFGNTLGESSKDEWLTPPSIIEALGVFDLDPCAPIVRPWPTAINHFTIEDDGLAQNWEGRVWCNPPYADATPRIEKLSDHGNGIALLFARTESRLFVNYVWPKATAILFIAGRLRFHHVNGKRADTYSGAPSVLIAYGKQNAYRLQTSGIAGKFVALN